MITEDILQHELSIYITHKSDAQFQKYGCVLKGETVYKPALTLRNLLAAVHITELTLEYRLHLMQLGYSDSCANVAVAMETGLIMATFFSI